MREKYMLVFIHQRWKYFLNVEGHVITGRAAANETGLKIRAQKNNPLPLKHYTKISLIILPLSILFNPE